MGPSRAGLVSRSVFGFLFVGLVVDLQDLRAGADEISEDGHGVAADMVGQDDAVRFEISHHVLLVDEGILAIVARARADRGPAIGSPMEVERPPHSIRAMA